MRISPQRAAALALALALLVAPSARAQSGTVEDIKVLGLVQMTRVAFSHAFGIRVGDPYDPVKIRKEFRKLWNMGLFSDIVVEAEDGPNGGKVLVVKVKERPILASVNYEENKILTRTQIEDRLKERRVNLDAGKPLNMKAVFDTETTIRDYLSEKGYLDAEVSHRVDFPTEATSAVSFSIRPGGKTRIRRIHFVGNKIFSERQLKKQLKLTRAWRWYWPWSAKYLYHPAKWDQDVSAVRDLYLDHGYLDVNIKPPVIEVRQKVKAGKAATKKAEPTAPAESAPPESSAASEEVSPQPPAEAAQSPPATNPSPEAARKQTEKERRKAEKARKKEEKARRKAEPKIKRWVYLTVPVSEGEQYRVGDVSVTGNSVFSEKELRVFLPLRKESVYNNAAVNGAIDAIKALYGNKGYLYANAVRQIERHPEEKTADIRIEVTEDKPYYVGRIDFVGNSLTRDNVLRRQVPLNEGDLCKRGLLDIGVTRVNQLGYFQAKEQPTIEPIEGEDRVKITISGDEQARNEIQIGGGYSGLDGAYFQGIYSTKNFTGRGQMFQASVQVGGRANRYSVSFQEPYLFGRPYLAGVSLYRTDVDYGASLTSSSQGAGITVGRQLGYFGRVQVGFNREVIRSTTISLTGAEASNTIVSLSPSYSYFRINNPYRPTRGWSVGFQPELAGGPLGGDTSFIKPLVLFTGYKRALKRTFFGLHVEAGQVRSWGGGRTLSSSDINGVPWYQRFFIGGQDTGPRGFETRSITPLRFVHEDSLGRILEAIDNPVGRPVAEFDRNGDGILNRADLLEVGGDRYFLIQAEYVIPFGSPVEAAFFFDAGNSIFEDTPWGFTGARMSAGLEMRFYLPVFPVPLRLIYAKPVRDFPGDRTSSFDFTIGRSF